MKWGFILKASREMLIYKNMAFSLNVLSLDVWDIIKTNIENM